MTRDDLYKPGALPEPATCEAAAELLRRMAEDALGACVKRGWRTDWSARGCYLHLEASEFIEACRGQGDSSKEEEAADVLMVFLLLCGKYDVDFRAVFSWFNAKLAGILAGKIGAGPEAP